MVLHTYFGYGAGSAAPGTELTYTPTTDGSIRAYDGHKDAELLGLFAGHSDPAAAQYLQLRVTQLPAYAENEVVPLVDNNDNALAGANVRNFWKIRGIKLSVGMDFDLVGISGGSDMFNGGILARHGPPIKYRPGRILRRYGAITLTSATTWTDGTAITDLDPTKMYGVRGMSCNVAAAKQTLGIRLVIAESGAHVGCTPGQEIDFVDEFGEYAAIIKGDSDPVVQGFSIEASGGVDWVLVLEELGGTAYTGTGGSGGSSQDITGPVGGNFFAMR